MQESFTTDSEETWLLQAAAWRGSDMALRKADMKFMPPVCENTRETTQPTGRDYFGKARKHKRTFNMHRRQSGGGGGALVNLLQFRNMIYKISINKNIFLVFCVVSVWPKYWDAAE